MRRTWLMLSISAAATWAVAALAVPPRARAASDGPAPASEAAPVEAAATAGGPTTFEGLLRAAVPTGDLATLLSPFADRCDAEGRDLDRVRCRAAQAYLRKTIPRRSFVATVDDPAVLTVSEFDGSIKGYHLSVAGCLACSRPVTVGRAGEARLVTLKAPAKEGAGESLRAAVELSRNSVGFDNLPDAKAWLQQSRPELRTQFVFRPADSEWTFGDQRGYAMTLLGFRVFNRCTGEVLVSRPPSAATAEVPVLDDACRRRDGAPDAGRVRTPAADLPAQLSTSDIAQAMSAIRPRVFACFQKFKVPGVAQFDFTVAGNGTVNGVRLSGAFSGTPTGACLLEAAKDAHFPRFSRERQQFVYPFFLRQ